MRMLGSLLLVSFAFAQDFEKLDKLLYENKKENLMHEIKKEKSKRKRENRQDEFLDKMDKLQKEKELIRAMEAKIDIEGQVGNIFIGKKMFIPSGAITPYGVVNVEEGKIGKYHLNVYEVRVEGGTISTGIGGGTVEGMLPPPPPPPSFGGMDMDIPRPPSPPPRSATPPQASAPSLSPTPSMPAPPPSTMPNRPSSPSPALSAPPTPSSPSIQIPPGR